MVTTFPAYGQLPLLLLCLLPHSTSVPASDLVLPSCLLPHTCTRTTQCSPNQSLTSCRRSIADSRRAARTLKYTPIKIYAQDRMYFPALVSKFPAHLSSPFIVPPFFLCSVTPLAYGGARARSLARLRPHRPHAVFDLFSMIAVLEHTPSPRTVYPAELNSQIVIK